MPRKRECNIPETETENTKIRRIFFDKKPAPSSSPINEFFIRYSSRTVALFSSEAEVDLHGGELKQEGAESDCERRLRLRRVERSSAKGAMVKWCIHAILATAARALV